MKQLASDEEVHELEEDIPVGSGQNNGNLVIFLSGKIHLSLGPDCKYAYMQIALASSLLSSSQSLHMPSITSKPCFNMGL